MIGPRSVAGLIHGTKAYRSFVTIYSWRHNEKERRTICLLVDLDILEINKAVLGVEFGLDEREIGHVTTDLSQTHVVSITRNV